ncbi:MAG TPA: ribonuclease Y [Planctomycetota bacterium]|nr:ribonuclease Y [Planctomycetota bacterium]
MAELLWIALGLLAGSGAGFAAGYALLARSRRTKAAIEAEKIVAEATARAEKIVADSRAEAARLRDDAERQIREERNELRQYEGRLAKKEDMLDKRVDALQQKERLVEQKSKDVERKERELASKEQEVERVVQEEKATLHRIAQLTKEEAVKLLLDKLEPELEREKADLIRKRLDAAKESAESEARRIISMAIQRFAASHTADSVVTVVDLPNEEMKGRIIGREGRNIRAFERATGVDVIVDDTPGVIVLSAFDGVRREMARRSMEKLILDGRIHPTRIEEITEQTKREMEEHINNVGKEFLREQDILNVHPKLVTLLGRLKYRTSYGQNVLQHIREVAHLCAVMAAELKLDVRLARRCGLFHDIGKAVDQEFEGSHPVIGGELLKRFDEPKEVVDAAANHHNDPDANYLYTVLAAAADAISASRPGARSESLERYVKRIEQLEKIAKSQPGVTGVYAIQAGREVRVLVDSDKVNDAQAVILARDIAKSIEEQMTYPGEIRVTVMRETRFVEYAR